MQPTQYIPQTNFADDEDDSVSGRSTVRTTNLDAEFDAIALTTDQLISNLSALQRDDMALLDGIVTVASLSPGVLSYLTAAGGVIRGAWVTATVYAVKDVVTNGSGTYICAIAHTSGVFATDLAAGKWVTLFSTAAFSASAVTVTPTGGIISTNVQAALSELDTKKAAKSANLSDLANVTTARSNLSVLSITEVQTGSSTNSVNTGTSDALVAAFTPVITALVNNMLVVVECTGANTGAATFTPNNGVITAKAIVRPNGAALSAADIPAANFKALLCYDLSLDSWILINPLILGLTSASIKHPTSTRTSNTILAAADNNTVVNGSGTYTQTFTAAATLADGWGLEYRNNGTGIITLDPNSAETINGLATLNLYPGESCHIYTDGVNLFTIGLGTGLIKVSRTVVSAAATVDFTSLPAEDVLVWEVLQLVAATNNTDLWTRVSQAAAFKTGASDYFHGRGGTTAAVAFDGGAGGDTKNIVWAGVNDAANNANVAGLDAEVRLFIPSNTTRTKRMKWNGSVYGVAGFSDFRGSGEYTGGTSGTPNAAIDGVRFMMSSGNIASAVIDFYIMR